MSARCRVAVAIVGTIICHSFAFAQQNYAKRSAIGPYWSDYWNAVPGKYSSAQAVCDARVAQLNWSGRLTYKSSTGHSGSCVDSSGRSLGSAFFGQHCPRLYAMKNYVEYSQTWFVEGGVSYGVYYGPDQYCESSILVVDRWHDKSQDQCTKFGNPVYPLSGAKQQVEQLLTWSPHTPALTATFDSRRKVPNSDPDPHVVFASASAASFGSLWESSVHKRLASQIVGNSTVGYFRVYQASRGAGNWVTFSRSSPANAAAPDRDVNDRLLTLTSGWRYTDSRARAYETYDGTGALRAVQQAHGANFVYTLSDSSTPVTVAPTAGLLIKVEDPFGRAIRFEYEQPLAVNTPRVSRIIDPEGLVIQVGYDIAGNLSRLVWADGNVRQFLYEQSELPWALTGIVDENGARFSTYAYDNEGRALSTEYADGVNRYSLAYADPPRWVTTESYESTYQTIWRDHSWKVPQGARVRTPNEVELGLDSSLFLGTPKVTSRSQPAGSGCDASTSSLTYDANGNIASKTDFNGSKSCHVHDLSRNLETTRVEGFSGTDTCPADIGAFTIATDAPQRKTTTQWHPDWSLPIRQAEPKQITTSIYNGQPDPTASNATASCAPASALLPDGKPIAVLCKKVEQPTTDANGSLGFGATPTGTAKTWAYTYNQYGQMLTARDPLNLLTTYTYFNDTTADHTTGDLQSVTNAAGHTTRYTRYDKSGRVLQSIDANGAVTDTTYSPRGWFDTVKVSSPGEDPQLTTYAHDGVGQLKKATLPDGVVLEYSYDAAHRLTGIKDNAGNSVTYTLDNMGNRKAEDLKDPDGTLARNITRVFDALNRVQGATGVPQ